MVTGLVGWEMKDLGMEPAYWQVLVDGEGQGGIMPMPAGMPDSVPANWMVYFMTDDIGASIAKVGELGGSITMAATEVPEMLKFAVVADPAGAVFALLEPRM